MYTKAEIEQALADTDGFNIKIPSNIKALAVLKEVAECYLCETFPFDWAKDAQPGMCGADNAGEKYWYIGRDPLQPSYLVFRVQELLCTKTRTTGIPVYLRVRCFLIGGTILTNCLLTK